MSDNLLLFILVAVVVGMAFALGRRGRRSTARNLSVHSGVQRIREIGHLSVFKVYTKEIVTESSHDWGDIGSRYLSWILTQKKMAMIFEFEIDFRYDLRSPQLDVEATPTGTFVVRMPPCMYEVHLRDIRFYDEQQARFLPWLLPDLINSFFSKGFTEEDKNRLVAAAKKQAEAQARALIGDFVASVESSARTTLEAICASFGAKSVVVDFARPDQPQVVVSYEASAAA